MLRMDATDTTRRSRIITFSSSLLSLESITPSASAIRSDVVVDESASGRNTETDHSVLQFTFAFLLNLKQKVCNNLLCTLEDAYVFNVPLKCYICRAEGTVLPFVFSILHTATMKSLNIEKLVPPALEVFNVNDASHFLVANVTHLSAPFLDASLMFGQTSLQVLRRIREL